MFACLLKGRGGVLVFSCEWGGGGGGGMGRILLNVVSSPSDPMIGAHLGQVPQQVTSFKGLGFRVIT